MLKSYEATRHRLTVPGTRQRTSATEESRRCIDSNADQKATNTGTITRHDILANGAAFFLRSLLTEEECRDLIEQAEGLGLKDCGYSERIRRTDRVAANSTDLARMLFERVRPFLSPLDLKSVRGPNWYPDGVPGSMAPYVWYPSELNPTFRICRYKRGGFFLPHHDGGFYKDDYCQSIQTFMLYLNDGFEGGATNFYSHSQRRYEMPDPDNLVHSYWPRTGDALIFNSQITHDGGKLTSGHKYIMRSEVLYSAFDELASNQRALPKPDHDPNVELCWP